MKGEVNSLRKPTRLANLWPNYLNGGVKIQINKVRDEKRGVATSTMEIQSIISAYFKNYHIGKLKKK